MKLAEIEIARAEKTKRWQSRRLIAALAAFGLASATVLASCGSGDDTATESTTTEAADVTSCEADPENPLCGSSPTNMQGKTIEFGYSRIAGWPPSAAPEAMWPQFQAYSKEKYGYDVSALKFAEAPFGELFQKVAPTLAAGSSEFNLMIVDSQWLGALAEPGWIVKAEDRKSVV